MAIYKLGPLTSGIRGTVGGVTFSAGSGGNTVRMWGKGSNPRTPLQTTHRGRLSAFPAMWRGLTSLQRGAWDTYAADPAQELTNALGIAYFASGWNWFVTINTGLNVCGQAYATAPPAAATPAAPPMSAPTCTVAVGSSILKVNYAAGTFSPSFSLIAFAAFIPGGGRLVQHSAYYLLLGTTTPGSTQTDLSAPFSARFGQANVGDKVFLRIHRQTSDGRRGSLTAVDGVFS